MARTKRGDDLEALQIRCMERMGQAGIEDWDEFRSALQCVANVLYTVQCDALGVEEMSPEIIGSGLCVAVAMTRKVLCAIADMPARAGEANG